ncbi:hypothetical protein [Halomonas urumqiensis]|nr:hypothetical protein [Halomonas urumqiensis]
MAHYLSRLGQRLSQLQLDSLEARHQSLVLIPGQGSQQAILTRIMLLRHA